MNINMINKLISPTSFCKMLYSTTMTGMERFFAVGRSSLSSASGTWWSFWPWVLGIPSWMRVSYRLTCLWEEVGEDGRREVAACPRGRRLM